MSEEVASKVKEIIVDLLGAEESKVTESASFTTDLGADSLETVDLIMKLEQEFDIEIPEEEANGITTVGQAIEYVQKAVAEK
ncbi:MAG: acyl carrier protein [Muribaculaceae bacterium]|nr:acyl carrier protein [Muribaculaceae bacterium]